MVKRLSLLGLLVLAVAVPIGYILNQTVDVEQTVDLGDLPPYFGPVTNEELILRTDAIIRGRLVSTSTAVTQNVDGYRQDAYWSALLEFTFSVTEYLKGSGSTSTQIVVILDDSPHDSAGLAQQRASWMASQHDTRWDDREAILFLYSTAAADRYILGYMFKHGVDGMDNYSLASDWQKVWLPAALPSEASGNGARTLSGGAARSTNADPLFLLDVPSATGRRTARSAAGATSAGTAPTISLSAFKQLISSVQAEIPADASQDYKDCVKLSYEEQRRLRHKIATEGTAVDRYDLGPVESGQPAGIMLWGIFTGARTQDNHGRHWFEGPDKDVVRFRAVNFRPSPDSPGYVNFERTIETARPLPAGDYQFFFNSRLWIQTICDKFSEIERNLFDGRLTVTRSKDIPGIQHEAFFDPVAIGAAVGADGTNGVLKPAAFTVGGTNTTITSLKWESGTATMVLNPSASLAGHAVDFIALDGSVTSTLAFDDATQSGGTLTWSAATQPWNAGDKLMLRIAVKPSIAISGLDASMEEGDSDAFTVSASNLASSNSYSIRVTTGGANVGFDAGCASRQQDAAVSSGSTSHDASFTLHGCSAPGGTITATLMQRAASVATATQQVTVTEAPTVQAAPAPTGLRVTGSTRTGVSLSWTSVQHAHRYKLERSPDGASGWSNVDDDISGTSRTVSGLSCGTTYHFRVSARGDGSTYSTEFGSPSTPSVSGATSACPTAAQPAISISGLDASMEEGDSDAFTVSASNLASSTSYTIRVTTGGANVGFDAGCASRQQDATVSSGSTSHDASFTLHGCSAPGGTVTAALMQGATAVATATQQVTVTAPTDTETDSAVTRYDTNGDGVIDVHEYLAALRDYGEGKITWAEVLEVAEAYEKARG